MNKFGFTISQPRSIDMDSTSRDKADETLSQVPSYKLCIGCGGCAATCTAGAFSDFNIRMCHTSLSRGKYELPEQQLQRCMLCGKCTLVCPRGVNLRALIITTRRVLHG